MALKISATVPALNSERHIRSCLESLKDFDEVILLDTGSTDSTLAIAAEFPNVKVFHDTFKGFGPTKNQAAGLARNDWVMNVDSDEEVTPQLLEEISSLALRDDRVYSMPRENHYRGRLVKGCGWYPNRQKRLYNRRLVRFNEHLGHDILLVPDHVKIVSLKGAIKHYSFDGAADLLDKMQRFSQLFARDNKGKRKSSPMTAIAHALWSFFKHYILQRGFLNGYPGFIISVSNANGVFYKYIKLYEEGLK